MAQRILRSDYATWSGMSSVQTTPAILSASTGFFSSLLVDKGKLLLCVRQPKGESYDSNDHSSGTTHR